MKIIGYITVTLALPIYNALMNGWALSKLWAWFIAPTFELPVLNIPKALGMACVVTYLTHQIPELAEKKESYGMVVAKGFVVGTLKPLFALLFGVIVKQWM